MSSMIALDTNVLIYACDRARTLQTQRRWSFWDALIVAACLECGVGRLYSEDLPGRDVPGALEVVNPFA